MPSTLAHGTRLPGCCRRATSSRLPHRFWQSSSISLPTATRQFLAWLHQFSLGRKRLLDTLLAATYRQAGIQSLLTTNQADFLVFGVFTCIRPEVRTTHS